MIILEGKSVAEKIKSKFEEKISKLEKKPCIAVLGIKGDEASEVYINRIQKNCEKYGIDFILKMSKTPEEFISNFKEIKEDSKVTGIMFQEPLPKDLAELINEVPASKDIEGIGIENMGKLMLITRRYISMVKNLVLSEQRLL